MTYWDGAIRDDLAICGQAIRKLGPGSFYAIATLSDAALAQCRAGRYREGEPNARAGLTGGAAYTLASCSMGLGRIEEAGHLLDAIDANQVAQLTGFPDWFANVALARGEIALRRGDWAAARKYAETAAPVFRRTGAEPFQKHALEALTTSLDKRAGGR